MTQPNISWQFGQFPRWWSWATSCLDGKKNSVLWKNNFRVNCSSKLSDLEILLQFFFSGKKWKSLTPSERAPCVQEAEKLRLKHMQVGVREGREGGRDGNISMSCCVTPLLSSRLFVRKILNNVSNASRTRWVLFNFSTCSCWALFSSQKHTRTSRMVNFTNTSSSRIRFPL